METSETQNNLELFPAESLLSAQASLANQRVLPGSDEVREMTVGSGRQLSMLLNQSSPLGAFSKTLMESSAWANSEEFCYVWQRLDTITGCSAFQLTPWERNIDDTDASLWRTPNASDITGGAMDGEKRLANGHHLNLVEQAATPKLWPTPNALGGTGYMSGSNSDTWRPTLEGAARMSQDGNPPNITAAEFKGKGRKAAMDAVKLYPTPTVADAEGGGSFTPTTPERKAKGGCSNLRDTVKQKLYEPGSGSLNPRFVEQLMGYEIDHSALSASATRWSPSKRSPSSKQSRKQ